MLTRNQPLAQRISHLKTSLAELRSTIEGLREYGNSHLGGCVPSADRIVSEFQRVEVGDILPWTPTADDGFVVRAVEPERALVLGEDSGLFGWALVLEPIDQTSTRLVTRVRSWYESLAGALMLGLFHPIHFGMQRRQLLNLKRRVEAIAAAGSR